MSDDLVKRLRGWPASVAGDTMGEAADRIEELEARAEAAEAELLETQDRANAFATKEYHTEMRAKQAEAKLAKARNEALEDVKRALIAAGQSDCIGLSSSMAHMALEIIEAYCPTTEDSND